MKTIKTVKIIMNITHIILLIMSVAINVISDNNAWLVVALWIGVAGFNYNDKMNAEIENYNWQKKYYELLFKKMGGNKVNE